MIKKIENKLKPKESKMCFWNKFMNARKEEWMKERRNEQIKERRKMARKKKRRERK